MLANTTWCVQAVCMHQGRGNRSSYSTINRNKQQRQGHAVQHLCPLCACSAAAAAACIPAQTGECEVFSSTGACTFTPSLLAAPNAPGLSLSPCVWCQWWGGGCTSCCRCLPVCSLVSQPGQQLRQLTLRPPYAAANIPAHAYSACM